MTLFCVGFLSPNKQAVQLWAGRKMFDVRHSVVMSTIDGKPVRTIVRSDRKATVSPVGSCWRALLTTKQRS